MPDNCLIGTFEPLGSLDALESRWRELESHSNCSFFLSWSWIGAWIRLVQQHISLRLYVCRRDGATVALAVISEVTATRRRLFRTNTIAINEVSRADFNVFIEYNGLLTLPGLETTALQQFVSDLDACSDYWDELQITNVPSDSWLPLKTGNADTTLILDAEHTAWIAPLDANTDLQQLYSRMSPTRRSKIRRSFKEYEKEGALQIEAAKSLEQALAFFAAMGALHTERWKRVGELGSFSNTSWVSFHHDLITSAFSRGEIQLLRILCGCRPIGYIYNFTYRGSVLMLQSGFASESSNLLRPGYVSHMLAMQMNARNGAAQYDFLIGDSDYKKVLAEPQASATLVSGRLQRRRVKFSLEDSLLRVYRAMRRMLSTPAAKPSSLRK